MQLDFAIMVEELAMVMGALHQSRDPMAPPLHFQRVACQSTELITSEARFLT